MLNQFSRTGLLLGESGMDRLQKSRVAVFGIGGVGGYVCEALVRSGVGAFDLIDNDTVSLTNLNRQIIASRDTIGLYKVDVMKERMLAINPDVVIRTYRAFVLPDNAGEFPFAEYDYVVDAVDTVTAKIELVLRAQELGIPVISSMGAGNKLDASRFRVADIYETKVCPLAKVMRRELRKRGVERLKVVYSEEEPISIPEERISLYRDQADGRPDVDHISAARRSVPGSTAFVPSVAGLIIAGEVVKDLALCPERM
ncbi:MAG: tRNA threonylcarbamoyladenosine dehydratase [Lachnospiraceae bacterium]|nr:tRNA threonylcarbamoyladenosine dehydratase [Lachnospiraceae bacterium]